MKRLLALGALVVGCAVAGCDLTVQAGEPDGADASTQADAGVDGGSGEVCTSSAEVTGSVAGSSFPAGASAAYVKSSFEYVWIGGGLVTSACCVDPTAAPAILSFGFQGLRAGTHEVKDFAEVDSTGIGTFVSVDTSAGKHYATSGTVTISKEGGQWKGTFTVQFAGAETLTGTFAAGATATSPCQ